MLIRLRWVKWMLAGILAAGSVSRGDDEPIEGDLKAIQGEWTVPSGFGGEVTYTFKGKKLAIESPNRSYKMTIKIDPKAKPEKSIDFHIDEGPDDAKGHDSKGIYKLDGEDGLTLCFSGEGDRPTKFEMIGFEQILTTLKKKKSADKKADEKKPTKAGTGVEPKAADGDAPLPEGWPDATSPGKIEVKKYPAYRSAITRAHESTSKSNPIMFFSLFNHIQKKGIEMTAPVVMTYDSQVVEKVGERGDVSMEFLYRRTDQGEAGPGVGKVTVEDFPAATFVCLGMQGGMNDDRLHEGVGKLEMWLKEHSADWVAAGRPRYLGYHGPMTPAARQLNEVQIPIKPAR